MCVLILERRVVTLLEVQYQCLERGRVSGVVTLLEVQYQSKICRLNLLYSHLVLLDAVVGAAF